MRHSVSIYLLQDRFDDFATFVPVGRHGTARHAHALRQELHSDSALHPRWRSPPASTPREGLVTTTELPRAALPVRRRTWHRWNGDRCTVCSVDDRMSIFQKETTSAQDGVCGEYLQDERVGLV
jgi:hypothetical protein